MQRTATPCTPVRFRPAPPFLPFKINQLPHLHLVDFLTQKISKLNPKYYPFDRVALSDDRALLGTEIISQARAEKSLPVLKLPPLNLRV